MVSPSFAPAPTKRASEVIYEQIYQKIASGELRPGDRLPAERVLAEQFQRSRPSIREALRMLQQNGLVRIETGCNGGAVVQSFTADDINSSLRRLISFGAISARDLAEYRRINDLGCARLAALNHTEEDAAALRRVMTEYRAALDDPEALRVADTDFHHVLSRASHNSMVIAVNDVITEMMVKVFWGITGTLPPEESTAIDHSAYHTHQALTDAVLQRDPVLAETRMGAIIDRFFKTLQLSL